MSTLVRGVLFVGLPLAALSAGLVTFGLPRAPTALIGTAPTAPAQQASVSPDRPPVALAPSESPKADAAKPASDKPVSDKAATPPTFDIVRVEPSGEMILAGRAEPGSTVVLMRNSQTWATATANAAGQFAMTPNALGVGTHELTLMMTTKDGKVEASRQAVTVDVPENKGGEVVVALVAPDKPTMVLSPPRASGSASLETRPKDVKAPEGKPEDAKPSDIKPSDMKSSASPQAGATGPAMGATTPVPQARNAVSIGVVEAEDTGTMFASGNAQPGANVRLYLNDSYLATAVAGSDGRWSFSIGKGLQDGSYKVRIDDVEKDTGKVLSRAEVGFDFNPRKAVADAGQKPQTANANTTPGSAAAGTTPADVHVPEIKTATVSRGDSLWRISQRIYGKGQRYTVIHRANTAQIRNPDLIYPGQIFVLPGEKPN